MLYQLGLLSILERNARKRWHAPCKSRAEDERGDATFSSLCLLTAGVVQFARRVTWQPIARYRHSVRMCRERYFGATSEKTTGTM